MGRSKSIAHLNKAVADELQAGHQYMYFHFHLGDEGFGPLSTLPIVEMGHIERFAERVLFVKGDVEMVPAGPVERITDPEAMLANAMSMVEESAGSYNRAAIECAQNADSTSKQMFEQVVNDEESHFDQFEKPRDNIKRFGPSYLALQSFGSESRPAASE